MIRQVPKFTTDAEAEAFLEQDLQDLDFNQFTPVRLEFGREASSLEVSLPESLVEAVKERARARGIPYQRFICEALEQALASAE